MSTVALASALLSPSLPVRRRAGWRRWLAVALLATLAPLVQAGTAEYTLLNNFLGGSKTDDRVSTADTTTLVNAVIAVINANPRVNPGTITGEALKRAGVNAPSAGPALATRVITDFPTGFNAGSKPVSLQAFSIQAIKTTGSGRDLNVTQVPGFSQPFYTTDSEAITLAIAVKSSARAAGAVLNGRALELTTEADRQALGVLALGDTGLASAVQDVAAGIASAVTDAVAFTNAVIRQPATTRNVLKILPGITAGQPTQAGAVVEAAFVTYNDQGVASPIVKGAATLAKSVGAIADIEQVGKVGVAIATRVGTNVIKLSSINGIATTLARAIVAKPLAITGATRNANKVDELGELAAYTLNAIATNVDFLRAPEKAVAALVKAILGGAKSTYGPSPTDIASYVIGSIAQTVANLSNASLRAQLTAYLQKPATATALGGKALVAITTQAIATGLNGTGQFENGTDGTGGLVDPETNTRSL